MDLKRLRTFVTVADEGGFARASKRLALAQPAVSKHVQELEQRIGGTLFERQPDGVRLTPTGEVLLPEARRLLADVAGVLARARDAAQGGAGLLRIGYNETVSWSGGFAGAVRRFRERVPGATLTMLPLTSVEQVAALRDRWLDAGFLFNRPPDDPGLAGASVLVDPILLAVPEESAWAKRPPKRLALLADEAFVWFPRDVSPVYYDQMARACQDAGLRPRVVQEVMNESATLSLVAVGMGITFAPASACWRCPRGVVLVPVPDLTLQVTLELVWREGELERRPLLARFVEVALSNPVNGGREEGSHETED